MDKVAIEDDGLPQISPRPWKLDVQMEYGELFHPLFRYCRGILDANNEWVIRFDDDYGNDQWANAEFIVEIVNGYDQRSLPGPVNS